MTPAELSSVIRAAVQEAVDHGELAVAVPARVTVERPKNREHGDYATNVALQLARPAGRPPREVAGALAARLSATPGIATVEVAGPGFLNLRLEESALGQLAGTIAAAGPAYGSSETNAGLRINLEFVSSNPTGPVHIGGARWAAVGDSVARLLEATGAAVTREYYFNDVGGQIPRFARSLYAAATGAPTPADGYAGDYIAGIAAEVVASRPGVLDLPGPEAVEVFRAAGVELMFTRIRQSLEHFGTTFDVYFLERSLHESGAVEEAVRRLCDRGHVYDADNAVWLRTTDFGDDKDRVLVKSDGETTYFAADLAYYLNKRDRGFDKVVIMLGADHHGYIGRMRAMVACYGDDPDQTLEILIGQLVTVHGGRMGKRAGNLVTLDDLVAAVGVGAARYSLARSSADSNLDLDIDLISRQAAENPVFYVQYAHARIASLLRHAADLGIRRGDRPFRPELLSAERESVLLGALGEFPRVVASAAELREPHRIARFLEEQIAPEYHRFYDACRVLPQGDEEATDLTAARLELCEATRVVLANGLALLGVPAPERM